ncbi:MAG: NAD(P)H-hydrate dehydratase [Gammaproteobacteria bacterium]|nr:NAD(P)H-hydrate dehydratase [Gammaproteobacteria bacterium]
MTDSVVQTDAKQSDSTGAILSVQQMQSVDEQTISQGTAGYTLLCNAGAAVARQVESVSAATDRILCVCGFGNNGGDALVAARLLNTAGYKVTVALCAEPDRYQGDARRALTELAIATHPIEKIHISSYNIIVDGLLGAGLNRAVEGRFADIIHSINDSAACVVSIDVPSGIDGNLGQVRGLAIRAESTVTFVRKKPAHVLYPARANCGQVVLRQIGTADTALPEDWQRITENLPSLWRHTLPRPGWEAHKYLRGHCAVASGPLASTGAARLAATAALRAGAGAVTLCSPEDAMKVNASHLTAEMLTCTADAPAFASFLKARRVHSCIVGPGFGLGERVRDFVQVALRDCAAVVLDADALTAFSDQPATLFRLINQSVAKVVLTPHAGEFDRLFGSANELQQCDSADKLQRARLAAQISQAVVVLKGPDTVIATPEGQCRINTNATPWLATAGSGDVLAGTVGGLLAQGMDAFTAASAGCWLHGEAASSFGPGLIATDIVSHYPDVLRELLDQR